MSSHWTSRRIKDLRQRIELSQARMARRLGADLSTYQAWEAGTHAPSANEGGRLDATAQAETARMLPVFRGALLDVLKADAGGALFSWDSTMGCYRACPASAEGSLLPGVEAVARFEDAPALEAALNAMLSRAAPPLEEG